MMNKNTESEILFHIRNCLDQEVDAEQILNHVERVNDGYQVRVYGTLLRFNEDGDLL